MVRVVATGTWLYDDEVPTIVRVVESDHDFWFEIAEADGGLTEHEQPSLNEHGLVYFVRTRPGWEPGEPFWPDSHGFSTVDAAKKAVESQVPGRVSWE